MIIIVTSLATSAKALKERSLKIKFVLILLLAIIISSGFYFFQKNGHSSSLQSLHSSPSNKLTRGNTLALELNHRLIDSNDYQCGSTELTDYVFQVLLADWTDDDFVADSTYWYLVWDYYYYLYNNPQNEYFGPHGEYTNAIQRTFRSLQRFWDIPTDILLIGAHFDFFTDKSKLEAILMFEDMDPALSSSIIAAFSSSRLYNNPFETFNAFATAYEPVSKIPKKVVMGDGILQVYDVLGYADVAPQAILAHEYGHQIQYDKGIASDAVLLTPESTRKIELQADAFAAYFLTHKRGAAMNTKRVVQFLKVYYDTGDCYFDDVNHHGTPNQRMKAAEFGFKVANSAQVQGAKLKSLDFAALFDQAYPTIVAPDV